MSRRAFALTFYCTHACSDRTGVQLKDKWRNLVKFKHVSKTEAENAASRSPGYRIRCCLAPL